MVGWCWWCGEGIGCVVGIEEERIENGEDGEGGEEDEG